MFVGKIFERVQPPIWGVERNFKAPILFANILNHPQFCRWNQDFCSTNHHLSRSNSFFVATHHCWCRFALGWLFFFFLRGIFFGSWFYAFLFLGFSAFLLLCFSAFLLLCFSASLLFCFSAFLLLCFHCFSAFLAFPALLFCFLFSLLLFFSAFCFPCLFAFLLLCFPCFSAFVLLCLSTSTILLVLFFSHVFLLLYFLLLCFFASCLYCLFVFHFLLLYSVLFVS